MICERPVSEAGQISPPRYVRGRSVQVRQLPIEELVPRLAYLLERSSLGLCDDADFEALGEKSGIGKSMDESSVEC
jgi:hypothetical protein